MPKLGSFEPVIRFGGHYSAKVATATGTSLAATCTGVAGQVTTESLTTAAAGEQTYVITNTKVAATDLILCNVANGTNTTISPAICAVTPTANTITIDFTNVHASAALNGTLVFNFLVLRPQ